MKFVDILGKVRGHTWLSSWTCPKKKTLLGKFVDKNKNVKFMANQHVSWWTYVHEIVR